MALCAALLAHFVVACRHSGLTLSVRASTALHW